MRNAVHISATLDKEIFIKFNEFCKREERSKSWLISKAIKHFLEEREFESIFSPDEWSKIEKLADKKGKTCLTGKKAKDYLAKL